MTFMSGWENREELAQSCVWEGGKRGRGGGERRKEREEF